MSLSGKARSLAWKYFLGPIWNSSPDLMDGLWGRSSRRRYGAAPRHWSRSLKLSIAWRVWYYAYFILLAFRFGGGVYLRSKGVPPTATLWQYDVWTAVQLYHVQTINAMSVILTSPLYLFLIYFDYMFTIKQYNCAWGLLYSHMVTDQKEFWRLNGRLAPKLDRSQPIESARSLLRILRWIWSPPKELKDVRFKVEHLPFVPPDSTKQIRAQTLVLSLVLQAFYAYVLTFIGWFAWGL